MKIEFRNYFLKRLHSCIQNQNQTNLLVYCIALKQSKLPQNFGQLTKTVFQSRTNILPSVKVHSKLFSGDKFCERVLERCKINIQIFKMMVLFYQILTKFYPKQNLKWIINTNGSIEIFVSPYFIIQGAPK